MPSIFSNISNTTQHVSSETKPRRAVQVLEDQIEGIRYAKESNLLPPFGGVKI